tara:strand:- start:2918 stop:3094 length:177 start_codon:yes stop_codon:yes gene_type:complete
MKREYKFFLLAILIFLGAELLLDYYLDGSSLEVKLLLAVTLFLIFNVFAKQLKQSKKP